MISFNNSLSKEDFVKAIRSTAVQSEDLELERIRAEEQNKKDSKRLVDFNKMVPPRYRTDKLGQCSNEKLRIAQRAVIYGGYGTGKTWAGYAIAKELYLSRQIQSFLIVRAMAVLNSIRKDVSNVHKYYDPDLLIIDEFGKTNDTDFSSGQIFDIIDYRYDWQKRTILICNATDGDQLKTIIPDAVKDRFKKNTYLFDGESRRVPE